jgi:exodeoxyribonuclease V alpha subunit
MTSIASLDGTVDQVIYQVAETGYAIAQFQSPSHKSAIKIVGHFAQIQAGQNLTIEGHWTTHPKYGEQFQVVKYSEQLPTDSNALEQYLASGLFKGIGKTTAKRIVAHFGDRTIDILDQDIDRLQEIDRFSAKKIKQIRESWHEQHAARQTLIFLQSHGLSISEAIRTWKAYESRTIELVQKNPYILTTIDRIGFLTADQVARSLGYTLDSEFRYESALFYTLGQVANQGHCCLPLKQLIEQTAKLLPQPNHRPNMVQLRSQVEALVRSQRLVQQVGKGHLDQQDLIYRPEFFQAETHLAQLLLSFIRTIEPPASTAKGSKKKASFEALSATYCRAEKIDLSVEQQQAIALALSSGISILVGAPGTGKTFTLKVLVALWRSQGKTVALASPTGRAAQRLSEVTGETAQTIHRLLEFNSFTYEFERNEERRLEADVIVIDETSMLDLFLAYALLKAIPDQAQLIFVGDPDQLPSVGAGRILQDLIDSDKIPLTRLIQIFRQAQASQIVTNAHSINKGQSPSLEPLSDQPSTDCLWLEANTPDQAIQALERLTCFWLPQQHISLDRVQVLVPMRKGEAGTVKLNRLLQQLFNPSSPRKLEWQRGETTFRVGDRIIQLVNNYTEDIFNGDLGVITDIQASDKKVTVSFPQRNVTYGSEKLDDMTHGFSLTVHKSQGSEYSVVIFILLNQHYPMLQRNLLYTGLTRAKQLAILVGTKQAIATAVKQSREQQRFTQLKAYLCELSS